MWNHRGNYSAFFFSLAIHAVLLVALGLIQRSLQQHRPELTVETVFEPERLQEEFSQELEVQDEPSETTNTVAGGVVSTQVGAATGPTVSKTKIETSESLQEPDVRVNPAEVSVPGEDLLGEDLGSGEVTGETGAVVEGYGDALGRITRELKRLMREQRVHAVWLFDESYSMRDDQKEIRDKFHTVYEELGIVQEQDEELRQDEKVLLTSIISFSQGVHPLTKQPTNDVSEIQDAIDRIPVDKETGKENICHAITAIFNEFGTGALKQGRRLVVIVVSDESGTDVNGPMLEETISRAKRLNAPIYVLGREAVFGYPYARIKWKDPKYKLWHWVQIDRGPETAYPECLQWDGLHKRHDVYSSGFGPYAQVRMAKESGGIFFLLPGEEENLTGAGANEKRKFDFLDMKEYQPLLLSRKEYAQRRKQSQFRQTIWKVISRLNPYQDKKLNIKEHHYPINPLEFQKVGKKQFDKAVRAMSLVNQAAKLLENVKPLRAKEESQRWRAAYDLMLAQCYAYRVRLFQFLLALDQHSKQTPKPEKPKSNEWDVRRRKKMLPPDPEQVKQTGVDVDTLEKQEQKARDLFQFVKEEHPGTPWARRAKRELNQGFGMHFVEDFRNPNYNKRDIDIPEF